MKKTSLLLAIGALLYGTTNVYALPEITPNMSNQDILDAIKDCPGVTSAADLTAEEAGAEDAVFDVTAADPLPPPPANIWVDDNDPVHMQEFCGFKPTGGVMADFPVSVNNGTSSATFKSFAEVPNSGIAIGAGWLLFQQGDTWDQKWCLVSEGMSITDIKIDPLSRTGPGPEKYAFDIIKDPTHSNEDVGGSQRGWPVVGNAVFTATYSQPVLVGNHPSDIFPPVSPFTVETLLARWNREGQDHTHDMYGTLEIKFKKPVSGSVDLPALFTYRADTDCLPVRQGEVISYDPETSTLVMNILAENDGLAAIMQRCDDDVSMVAGTFELNGDNGNTITTSLPLESSCCYSLVDVDSQNPVPLLGVTTNANNEYCP
jgi:hypothetical protein